MRMVVRSFWGSRSNSAARRQEARGWFLSLAWSSLLREKRAVSEQVKKDESKTKNTIAKGTSQRSNRLFPPTRFYGKKIIP